MKFTGTCHCKTVSFTFKTELEELLMCNCSLCQKRNSLMATVAREQFHITEGQEALRLYRWNSGEIGRASWWGRVFMWVVGG